MKEDLMAGSIICGVDDSESAKGAARVARRLSARLGVPLVFMCIAEAGSPEAKVSAIAERLEHLTARANEADCGAGWLVDVGHPADRLIAAATDEEASLIVVGSTGPRSSLLGSVSTEVSRRAPCPVVVVPPGADQLPPSGHYAGHGDTEFAGGIARFSLGSPKDGGMTDFAGGIARFNLGSAVK
jgi:nucleotide-binding universal stress UspA family protein